MCVLGVGQPLESSHSESIINFNCTFGVNVSYMQLTIVSDDIMGVVSCQSDSGHGASRQSDSGHGASRQSNSGHGA